MSSSSAKSAAPRKGAKASRTASVVVDGATTGKVAAAETTQAVSKATKAMRQSAEPKATATKATASKVAKSQDRITPATKIKEKVQAAKPTTKVLQRADNPMPKNTKETESTTDTNAADKTAPAKLPTASPAQEQHLQDLLSELEGKSETAQRPIIDEILLLGPATIKTLSKALNSGATFQVRMASATALGELGDERCVAPLVQALADTSLNVQRAAAHALSLLGQPAVEPLLVSLDSPDDSVRRWASEVLGKLGRKVVAAELISRLDKETVEVQKAMIIALGELGSAKATVPLIGSSALRSTSTWCVLPPKRSDALGDERGIENLIECLDSRLLLMCAKPPLKRWLKSGKRLCRL
jgi:hypothetical protein